MSTSANEADERVDPENVYAALLLAAKHPVKKRNLEAVHSICKKRREAGSVSFRNVDIGRALEAEGIMVAKALNNRQSEDYRTLIKAWADSIVPAAKRSPPRIASDWIDRIEDAAIRSLVEAMRIEIADLRSKNAHLQIHQKPVVIYKQQASQGSIAVVAPISQLTQTERETLARSVSAEDLRSRGLSIGSRGEIINVETGEIVFPRGFVTGIKKLLAS